jgi:hypothetical protein
MRTIKIANTLKYLGISLILIVLLVIITIASIWYWSPRSDEEYGGCTTRWLGHGTFLISQQSSSPLRPILKKVNADYKTIESIENHPGYCRDKKNIYFWGIPISGVDIGSFSFLTQFNDEFDWQYYTKDKNHVYAGYQKFPSADFESFEEIGSGYYKDKNHIYFRGGDPSKETFVLDADLKTFTLFDSRINAWAKDATHVFSEGKMIPYLDPVTFAISCGNNIQKEGNYAKDAISYIRMNPDYTKSSIDRIELLSKDVWEEENKRECKRLLEWYSH